MPSIARVWREDGVTIIRIDRPPVNALSVPMIRVVIAAFFFIMMPRFFGFLEGWDQLIGAVMLVNAAAGFAVPLAVGIQSVRAARVGDSRP